MAHKTKLCPRCKMEIDNRASKCPYCKSNIGISLRGLFGALIFILVIIAIIIFVTAGPHIRDGYKSAESANVYSCYVLQSFI